MKVEILYISGCPNHVPAVGEEEPATGEAFPPAHNLLYYRTRAKSTGSTALTDTEAAAVGLNEPAG